MTNKPFKLGFIGGGINSAVGASHFIASQMDNRFHVEAGCFSRDAEVNSQTARQWNISHERVYSDWGTLLKQEQGRLDAVVVLTPTPNHLDPVVQALRNGYSVICEKALTSSSVEAQQIRATVEEQRGFLTITYNYTGYPMLRELRQLIAKGSLGRIEQIHIEMPQESYLRRNRHGERLVPQQWRLRDAEVPTLSLDLGVHLHHLIDFLTGQKPQELVAVQSNFGSFEQIIDNCMCIAHYSEELVCNMWFSKSALGHRNGLRVRVFGERASAEWYQMDPEFLVHHDNQGRKTIIDRASVDADVSTELRYNRFKSGHPSGFLEAFANLYVDIADGLQAFREIGKQGSEFTFTVEHALEGLVMLEAIAESSRRRSWQTLKFPK